MSQRVAQKVPQILEIQAHLCVRPFRIQHDAGPQPSIAVFRGGTRLMVGFDAIVD